MKVRFVVACVGLAGGLAALRANGVHRGSERTMHSGAQNISPARLVSAQPAAEARMREDGDQGEGFSEAVTPRLAFMGADEESGDVRRLFARWESNPDSRITTQSATTLVLGGLRSIGVKPQALYLRCTQALCRLRWRFASSEEVAKLAPLTSLVATNLVATTIEKREGAYTFSVYWAAPGRALFDDGS